MQLKFRQRVFSWFDTYDITDGIGATVFSAKGKFSLWGHKLIILDNNGQEIGMLKECMMRIRPKFKFTFNPWEVKGNLFAFDYQIVDGQQLVATVSKELFHLSDTYTIDVVDPKDALLSLMVVLGIDIAKERKARRRSNH